MSTVRFRFPSLGWGAWFLIGFVVLVVLASFQPTSRLSPKFRKSEAITYAKAIERAVIDFSRENGDLYPVGDSATEGDIDVTSAPGSATIRILVGKDSRNARGMDFLGDMKQAKMDKDGRWIGGVIYADSPGGGSFGVVDPWGNPYHIRMDTDFNGSVADPRSPSLPPVSERVIVWSAGADRDLATWEDNIKSWKDNSVQPALK